MAAIPAVAGIAEHLAEGPFRPQWRRTFVWWRTSFRWRAFSPLVPGSLRGARLHPWLGSVSRFEPATSSSHLTKCRPDAISRRSGNDCGI